MLKKFNFFGSKGEVESMIDWDEMFEYPPGTTVELKSRPGVIDRVDFYEAMMVPPIWLVNDPRPRYPHELRIVSRQGVQVCSVEEQPVAV
jgi:hypothetical protein